MEEQGRRFILAYMRTRAIIWVWFHRRKASYGKQMLLGETEDFSKALSTARACSHRLPRWQGWLGVLWFCVGFSFFPPNVPVQKNSGRKPVHFQRKYCLGWSVISQQTQNFCDRQLHALASVYKGSFSSQPRWHLRSSSLSGYKGQI